MDDEDGPNVGASDDAASSTPSGMLPSGGELDFDTLARVIGGVWLHTGDWGPDADGSGGLSLDGAAP